MRVGERGEPRTSAAGSQHPPRPEGSADTRAGLAADAHAKLAAYLDLLAKWNRVYNLTAIRDRRRMESHHVDDALAVLPFLPSTPACRLLDVGSGGGVPGIPLAIARPRWSVVLVDASTKKAAFLQQAAIELVLSNVRVVASRIEDFHDDARFDVVISRAFSELAPFARVALPHVSGDGVIVAMKGAYPGDEIAALARDVALVAAPALDVPGLDAQRHLVILRKAR
jgi:16S rRNA (guanine527-N7)-methyltransferase